MEILEQQMQGIPKRKNNVVKQNLVLVNAANDIHHDVRLHLIQHDPVVIEDDIAGLLRRLF